MLAAYYGVPNYGGDDLYIRTRESTTEDFGPLTNLGTPVNSSGIGDCCAEFGILDSTFYFTSTRPGGPDSGLFGFINIWQAPIAESVPVDIKPGGGTAPINLKSKGVLPVAIYTTDEIDATQIDPETLLFGDPC